MLGVSLRTSEDGTGAAPLMATSTPAVRTDTSLYCIFLAWMIVFSRGCLLMSDNRKPDG